MSTIVNRDPDTIHPGTIYPSTAHPVGLQPPHVSGVCTESEEHDSAEPEVQVLPDPTWQHKLTVAMTVALPFLGCVAAIVLLWQYGWMGWLYLSLMIGGWWITGVGITVGFHRLLTHRSFDTYRPVRLAWMILGSLAIEGPPLIWCSVHRCHHQHSDKEGDPHSPHLHAGGWWNAFRSFVHAHTGWMFTHSWSDEDIRKYVPDLVEDRWMVAMDRYYYLAVISTLAIPTAIGGLVTMSGHGALLGFIWGGLVRVFATHHVTWSINSVCHVFGRQDYPASDQSRNNFLFGILGHGEGWHNNHHAFPTSARHGLKWWQFDSSWYIIRTMQLLGLAWNVQTPKGLRPS